MPSSPNDEKEPELPLPPRRETFLARYPRHLKIGAVAALLVVAVLIFSLSDHKVVRTGPATTPIAVAIHGQDAKAALGNPSLTTNAFQIARSAGSDASAVPVTTTAGGSDVAENENVFMTPAPDPNLSEDTPQGSLPRVGEDGRQPWQAYARPFNTADKRPRVSIVVVDLGLSRVASDAAIDRLPPNVTLAFDVQSPVVGAWCARARQAGHETLLMVPMEPFDYPRSDPGPNTLLSNLPNSDNLQRLQWALRQGTGYVGITTLSGSRFTTDPDKIKPILEELRRRGLMIFDARVAPHSAIADLAHDAHVAVAVETQRIDQNLAPAAIDTALNQLEQTARLTCHAVGMAAPLPVVLDRLGPWIKQLRQDGVALAPLSAMTQ